MGIFSASQVFELLGIILYFDEVCMYLDSKILVKCFTLLLFTEYVVYDPRQTKMRYLVWITFKFK